MRMIPLPTARVSPLNLTTGLLIAIVRDAVPLGVVTVSLQFPEGTLRML